MLIFNKILLIEYVFSISPRFFKFAALFKFALAKALLLLLVHLLFTVCFAFKFLSELAQVAPLRKDESFYGQHCNCS